MKLFALALALLAGQDVPYPIRVGDWLVAPLENAGACQAEARFGDHYLLNISEDAAGNGHLIFADDRLLLRDGDIKPATYSFDGWKTAHQGSFSAVRAPSGASFLVMETGAGFTEEPTESKGLWLRIPGIDFDNDFAIPHSGGIARALAACNARDAP